MARGAGVSGRGRGRGRAGALEGAAMEQIAGLQPEVEEGTGAVDGTGVAAAELAGGGAGERVVGADNPGVLGAAAGVAQGQDGGLADLLRQLLERLPGVVPVQAPVAQQVPVAPRVQEEVQPRAAVAGGVPSYIKMMEQLQKIAAQPKRTQQQVAPGRGGKPAQGQKRKWDHTSRVGQSGQGGRAGCFSCGSLDHKVADYTRRVETRECYHCKEKGHLKPNCPKLQRTAVAAVQQGAQPQGGLQLAQIAAPP
ncbi:unnamed protein product [Arabidopsis arenosa]|uniref:CCHC-type domain-containing protein n=1 Tax=Arabidopsis arenosa TaxID=38785 RepID=A0A8S2AX20_ARAAE|nr:unnamed protein product [Arabidopsis arenosa]